MRTVLIVSFSQAGRSRCTGAAGALFFNGVAALGAGDSTGRLVGVGAGDGVGLGGVARGAAGGLEDEAAGAGVEAGLGELEPSPCSFARRFRRIYRV